MRSDIPLLGITGLPGSGKTSFAACLASLGATVVSADAVGHEVLREPSVTRALARRFGPGVLGAEGVVDRAALGAILSGHEEVDALNRIVHPPLLKRLAIRTRHALSQAAHLVVLDAALIPEWAIGDHFDLVVFVAAPSAVRRTRVAGTARNAALIDILEECQFTEDEKKARCHIVVENSSTLERLHWRANAVWKMRAPITEEGSCSRRLWSD